MFETEILTLVIRKVLLARGDSFKPHEAGFSSLFFVHATIITHGECISDRSSTRGITTNSVQQIYSKPIAPISASIPIPPISIFHHFMEAVKPNKI